MSEQAIGIVRQLELFREIETITGKVPPVIDSNDVLRDPAAVLKQLCQQMEVPWHADAMLRWPTGRRDSDGVCPCHWYQSVEQSTGFAAHRERAIELEQEHLALAQRMQASYQQLYAHRIGP